MRFGLHLDTWELMAYCLVIPMVWWRIPGKIVILQNNLGECLKNGGSSLKVSVFHGRNLPLPSLPSVSSCFLFYFSVKWIEIKCRLKTKAESNVRTRWQHCSQKAVRRVITKDNILESVNILDSIVEVLSVMAFLSHFWCTALSNFPRLTFSFPSNNNLVALSL